MSLCNSRPEYQIPRKAAPCPDRFAAQASSAPLNLFRGRDNDYHFGSAFTDIESVRPTPKPSLPQREAKRSPVGHRTDAWRQSLAPRHAQTTPQVSPCCEFKDNPRDCATL